MVVKMEVTHRATLFMCVRVCMCACAHLQELKGKFLIKGKRLNKLEASFTREAAAADDTDVTEEDESNDEEEEEEEKSKVGVASRLTQSVYLS